MKLSVFRDGFLTAMRSIRPFATPSSPAVVLRFDRNTNRLALLFDDGSVRAETRLGVLHDEEANDLPFSLDVKVAALNVERGFGRDPIVRLEVLDKVTISGKGGHSASLVSRAGFPGTLAVMPPLPHVPVGRFPRRALTAALRPAKLRVKAIAGSRFMVDGGGLAVDETDNIIFARRTAAGKVITAAEFVIDRKHKKMIAAALRAAGGDTVAIYYHQAGARCWFKSGHLTVSLPVLSGDFPRLPALGTAGEVDGKKQSVVLVSADWRRALLVARAITKMRDGLEPVRHEVVRSSTTVAKVVISATWDGSAASCTLDGRPATGEGEDFSFFVDARVLAAALAVLPDGGEVELVYNGFEQPISLFTSDNQCHMSPLAVYQR